MNSIFHAGVSKNDLLAHLLSRQSHWPLQLPVPSDEDLHLAFEVAMRAPDHANQRPWRFIVVRKDAQANLGEVFAHAAIKRGATDDGARSRSQALAAPLIIAVGVAVSDHAQVPAVEQIVATGAAAMNLLNAIHILGFAAYWASGDNAYDPDVASARGLKGAKDRLLGFIYVGSQVKRKPPKARPTSVDFVTYWETPFTS
ncbi:putative NAD(P)H nitroreductase YdjA [compost metagenome]